MVQKPECGLEYNDLKISDEMSNIDLSRLRNVYTLNIESSELIIDTDDITLNTQQVTFTITADSDLIISNLKPPSLLVMLVV